MVLSDRVQLLYLFLQSVCLFWKFLCGSFWTMLVLFSIFLLVSFSLKLSFSYYLIFYINVTELNCSSPFCRVYVSSESSCVVLFSIFIHFFNFKKNYINKYFISLFLLFFLLVLVWLLMNWYFIFYYILFVIWLFISKGLLQPLFVEYLSPLFYFFFFIFLNFFF